jgi:hypothetical protein
MSQHSIKKFVLSAVVPYLEENDPISTRTWTARVPHNTHQYLFLLIWDNFPFVNWHLLEQIVL